MGCIKSINVSSAKGGPKGPVPRARLVVDVGIEGDAHSGPGKKQVSLLAWERTLDMRERCAEIGYGSFGENITTEGIDLRNLRVGDSLRLGDEGILEVTELGKKCPAPCEIFRRVGFCIMPEEGVFCRVVKGGEIAVNDPIEDVSSIKLETLNSKSEINPKHEIQN